MDLITIPSIVTTPSNKIFESIFLLVNVSLKTTPMFKNVFPCSPWQGYVNPSRSVKFLYFRIRI